ncbi:MAG TPA: stage II sporulation protein M [Chitinophagaceae bacterium]|nr:stage II sporulation protein M [Chitinophagaceae bacterium]
MKFSPILPAIKILMREAQFLKQNAEKWKRYELEVQHFDNPDTFADRFIELTDDLAYARTFYPKSNTATYLNKLAALFHQKIYKNKKEKSKRIASFWQFELPHLFRQYHRQLLYAFLFFIAFCLAGALSAKYDESFIRLILGDGYVNMTNENIEKGDPFGVYKHGDSFTMFLAIAMNNIKVAFLCYVFGITFSIGTVYLLVQNGLMVGAFLQFFIARHLGYQAVLAIFIHGTIELSVIVIAGCAGLVLGSGLLFPKTYTRSQAILRTGKDGLKIVIGLLPFFIVAAFLESFVTRHYQEMPAWSKLAILGTSFLFIIWYFIVYPLQLHKRVRAAAEGQAPNGQNLQVWLNKKWNSEK